MNRLSVRAHDLGKMSAGELITQAKALGFDGIQLVFSKALIEPVDVFDPATIPPVLKTFPIDLLGGYFNLVHPDESVVEEGIVHFQKLLGLAKEWGASAVGTETGSLMGSPWGYVPENHSDAMFERVAKIVKELVKTAETSDSTVAIEGAWAHVVYSPKQLKRLLDEIPSVHLKVIVDLYNFLNVENHERHFDLLKECLDLFGNRIHAFHLKDYVVENGVLRQVGLGVGKMDYAKIIPAIEEACPDAPLIFEGVQKKDMERSLTTIRSLQRRNR